MRCEKVSEAARKEINIQIEKGRQGQTELDNVCKSEHGGDCGSRWKGNMLPLLQFKHALDDHLKKKSTYTHRSLRDEVLDSTVVSEINQRVTRTKSPTIRHSHPVSFRLRTH